MKRYQWTVAIVVLISAATVGPSASAALVGRDLNADGIADAYYDGVLNITWLADANAGRGSGYDYVAGLMDWGNAMAWTQSLNINGVLGWRLPSVVDTGAPGCYYWVDGTDCGFNSQTTSLPGEGGTVYSEFASLYYDTLGNSAFQPKVSDGPFLNVGIEQTFWTSTAWSAASGRPDLRFTFNFDTGAQSSASTSLYFFGAWAVHDGDVGSAIAPISVPEPGTLALLGLGLLGLSVSRIRNFPASVQ